MKKFFILSLMVGLVIPAWADKKGSYLRGGLGFLFPDANSFVNGGQMALNKGVGLEANYSKQDDSEAQAGTASFVWAGGGSGLGLGVTRIGSELDNPATSLDVLQAQAGASLVKDSVTVGAVYTRALENIVGADSVGGQVNFNFGRHGEGWVMGLGATTTLGRETNSQSGKVGLGYALKGGIMMEASYGMDDLENAGQNHTMSGSFVYNGSAWYVAGQYNDVTTEGLKASTIAGRLGLVWRKLDLSAQMTKGTTEGSDSVYGGTLRLVF
jgi:hypothetical protein